MSNPLSHHVMVSSNSSNSKDALAPDKEKTFKFSIKL